MQRLPDDAPVLILLPGLTGGSEDSYVQHAVVRRKQGRRAGCLATPSARTHAGRRQNGA